MNKPFDEKKFYEENKDTTFYYLYTGDSICWDIKEIRPDYYGVVLWYYPDEVKLSTLIPKFRADWEDIYETREEAENALSFHKKILGLFGRKPYLTVRYLIKNYERLIDIENKINDRMSVVDDYGGVDFSDTLRDSIRIRVFHKDEDKYAYERRFFVLYDFSNADEVIDQIAHHFGGNRRTGL